MFKYLFMSLPHPMIEYHLQLVPLFVLVHMDVKDTVDVVMNWY